MSAKTTTAAEYRKAVKDGTLHMLAVDKRAPELSPPYRLIKRAQPERALQRDIAKYLDSLGVLWFHPRNEGANRIERMRLSAEGVKAGVPDIVIVHERLDRKMLLHPRTEMLWIEVKAPGGSLSKAQREWRNKLKELGHEWHLVRSVEEVRAIMEER